MNGSCSTRMGAIVLIAFASLFLMCHSEVQYDCRSSDQKTVLRTDTATITTLEKDGFIRFPDLEGVDPTDSLVLNREREFDATFVGDCDDCDERCSKLDNSVNNDATGLKGNCVFDNKSPKTSYCACCIIPA